MKGFYDKFTFLLCFMIFIVFFNMILGEKSTEVFLALVLLGMVLSNIDTVKNIFANLEG